MTKISPQAATCSFAPAVLRLSARGGGGGDARPSINAEEERLPL